MKKDKKIRLSIEMDHEKHKKLKMHCVEKDISISKFVLEAIDNKIESYSGINN